MRAHATGKGKRKWERVEATRLASGRRLSEHLTQEEAGALRTICLKMADQMALEKAAPKHEPCPRGGCGKANCKKEACGKYRALARGAKKPKKKEQR